MIYIFKRTASGLQKVEKIEKGCWINVVNPTNEELGNLHVDLNIPMEFLTDPTDIDERARIEVEGNILLTILRIPFFDKENLDISYMTLPIGILFTEDVAITIFTRETETFIDFISGCLSNFSTDNRSRTLLQIFFKTALLYLKYLKEINRKTSAIEKELHLSMKNEELIKLLNLEKSLVYFITSLKSNEIMMEKLERMGFLKREEDKELLDDVIIENKQAIEMANIYSNILSGMMDAFASVISNNVNTVMKTLTSVTIILMIPTLVASVYGMNVDIPFGDSRVAFLITALISFILSFIGIMILKMRKWF
jgi:magnesium transporter